jgi:hypothetical protein
MPVIDDGGKVIGLFHKADVTFVTKSSDPDSVLTNLTELFVGDAIQMQQQQLQSGVVRVRLKVRVKRTTIFIVRNVSRVRVRVSVNV